MTSLCCVIELICANFFQLLKLQNDSSYKLVLGHSTQLSDVVKLWYGNYDDHYENVYKIMYSISERFFIYHEWGF